MSKARVYQLGKWLISPTLYVSDRYKRSASSKTMRGEHVKRLNKLYLLIAIGMALFVGLATTLHTGIGVLRVMRTVVPVYAISRCNEIFMAFIKDVFDKLNGKRRDKNGLEYFERIQLALRSYIELILHYSMMYFLLDTYQGFYHITGMVFNQPLGSLFNAIYFSVITIVSIGYGDYYPVHPIAKGLVIYEVISGMLLLVVSFTVYVNLTLDE